MDFYEGSARYYDLMYGSVVDYEGEGDLLEGVFERYAERPIRRILDLGSGTGNHALALASRGYDVVGVDRSEAFVAAAEEKARDREDGPRFVVGDMREPEVEGRFDALICMFGAFATSRARRRGSPSAGFRNSSSPGESSPSNGGTSWEPGTATRTGWIERGRGSVSSA